MKSVRPLLIACVALVVVLFLFFFRREFYFFTQSVRSFFVSFFDRSFSYEAFQKLQVEYDALRSQIADHERKNTPESRSYYLASQVYSRYPFNDRNTLIVNRGSADGVKEGMPVILGENILAGKVVKVKRTQSEVMTLFDPNWKSSVIIGEQEVKAVLQGGIVPRLELIPKESGIHEGDVIKNISPELPLHLFIGKIDTIKNSSYDAWISATFHSSFFQTEPRELKIITDFP